MSAGLAVKYVNAAARIICLVPKFDRISPYLKDLHWLSVELRIELKVLLRVFKTLNGMAPRYISSGIRHFTTIASNLAICLATSCRCSRHCVTQLLFKLQCFGLSK